MQAGASYDFSFVRVYGQVGQIKTEATDDERTTSVPARRRGARSATASSSSPTARRTSKTPSARTTDRTTSIGYDYFLSKSTDIYVAAMYEKLSFVSSGNSFAGGVRFVLAR